MVSIKEQLVLVGGSSPGLRVKSLGVWNDEVRRWTCPYPDMGTCRTRCSAVVYKKWLVVAGGRSTNAKIHPTSVEIMNVDTNEWFNALSPLPTAWVDMKTAVMGDTCYFMGGCTDQNGRFVATSKIFGVCLPTLVSQSSVADGRIWCEFDLKPDHGHGIVRSTPLSLGGSLLALGGKVEHQAITAIHCYLPDDNRWEKIGDLSVPRFNCACAQVSCDSEIIIVGGCRDGTKMKRMDIGAILL